MEQFESHKPKENPISIEFNKSFAVSLPAKEIHHPVVRYKAGEFINLYETSLSEKHGGIGTLDISGFLFPDRLGEREVNLLPAGHPRYELSLDKLTGLAVAKEFPVFVHINFGPVSEDQIRTNAVGVSLFYSGREFRSKITSFPFSPRDNISRKMTTSNGTSLVDRWTDVETGEFGPLIFPLTVDFKKIQFVIKKTS